jgi:hypothetical protein
VQACSGLLWPGRPAPLTAIPALAIPGLALPSRRGFGAHPGSGLLEQIFLALELLWFLLAALGLTPGQPPAPAHPPPPGQPLRLPRSKPPTGTLIPPAPATSGWWRPERVCCISPGENLGG